MAKYVLSVDQSTQGTKALLFSEGGELLCRADRPHRQITDEHGWVEHDPEEIYANTLQVIKDLTEKAGISKDDLAVLGISNQRETSVCWNRKTGIPVYNAIVWQCARGAAICDELEKAGWGKKVRQKAPTSPSFRRGSSWEATAFFITSDCREEVGHWEVSRQFSYRARYRSACSGAPMDSSKANTPSDGQEGQYIMRFAW